MQNYQIIVYGCIVYVWFGLFYISTPKFLQNNNN